MLLGFDDDKYVTKDTWYNSGEVNINHGLKYVKTSAAIVYDEIYSRAPITKDFSSVKFSLSTNISWHVEVNALLDIEII